MTGLRFVNQDGKVLRTGDGTAIEVETTQTEDVLWKTMVFYPTDSLSLIYNGTLIDDRGQDTYVYVRYGVKDEGRFKTYLKYAFDKEVNRVILPKQHSNELKAYISELYWLELLKLGGLFASTPAAIYILKMYNDGTLAGTSRDLDRVMNAANRSIKVRQKEGKRSSLWN